MNITLYFEKGLWVGSGHWKKQCGLWVAKAGGGTVAWSDPRCGWVWLLTQAMDWAGWYVFECVCVCVCVCMHIHVFCILISASVKLVTAFCIHFVFLLQTKSCISKCKICVMLRLFPNGSVTLEQIHFQNKCYCRSDCATGREGLCAGALERSIGARDRGYTEKAVG